MATACNTCRSPGHCCKILMLGGVTKEAFPTRLEAQAIAAAWPFEPTSLPFIATVVIEGYWAFTCPLLDWETGRCTEYETRPSLCRNFEPLSDPLCIMHEKHNQQSASRGGEST